MKHLLLSSLLFSACSAPSGTAPTAAVPEAPATDSSTKDNSVPAPAKAEDPAPKAKGPAAAAVVDVPAAAVGLATAPAPILDASTVTTSMVPVKRALATCTDPDVSKLLSGVTFMKCDGTTGTGTLLVPAVIPQPDLSLLTPGNLKLGVTVANVTGTYAGAAQPDLSLLTPANLKQGVTINGVAGTLVPSPNLSLLTASNLKQGVTINGVNGTVVPSPDLTLLTAGNLKSAVVINGVTGTLLPAPAACSANAQVGCVTTSAFQAADLTNLVAGNIKAGAAVAGVSGQYPSASYPLTGASGTELDLASFNARIKSASSFSWFDSTGARFVNAGDPNITAANIVAPTTIFGMTGTSTASTINPWDLRVGVSAGTTTGALKVDCQDSGIAVNGQNQWCDFSMVDESGGACNATTTNCMAKEQATGVHYARFGGSKTYANAKAYCAALNLNGLTNWRLPTAEEIWVGSAHRFMINTTGVWGGLVTYQTYVWTITVSSATTAQNLIANLASGETKSWDTQTTAVAETLCAHN